ncbi:hypothetical protein COOONC_18198, partial [Cooperia oncophora]
MQYLQDMGQAVTAALANFGIDASYEVRNEDKKESSAEDKSKTSQGEQVQQAEDTAKKDNAETAPNETQPPTNPPAASKFDSLKSAEAEYCQAMERAKEINESLEKAKEMNEDYQEEAETENSEVVKAPSE